ASGLVWMASQTIFTKALSVISQIVLARKLAEKDFTLVALAFAVAAFPSLLQQIGIREVLVQRHSELDKLRGPAFWLCIFIGLIASLGIFLLGPIVAHIYKEPELVGLTNVLAIGAPFGSLMVIPLVVL